MPKRPKIHFAGGPDPKIGAHVQSACGALATRWTLDAPLTRDVQSVTCGACQRSHLWRAVPGENTNNHGPAPHVEAQGERKPYLYLWRR